MKILTYIGRFTPSTGGVNAKNTAIYNALCAKIPIEKWDLSPLRFGNKKDLLPLIGCLFNRNRKFIIGTSDMARRIFTMLLYYFNRKALNESILMIMGGHFALDIKNALRYQKWLKEYKAIYVETQKMKEKMEEYAMHNVLVFPNCRRKPDNEIAVGPRNGKLKCVCFSMLYPEKGIDFTLSAAKQLPDIDFDFWGGVREDYKEEFFSEINNLPNCRYNGVFITEENDVYEMLNQYDLFLFLTRHKGEGVPGALIEAKIAGLPAIASDVAYNSELVENGISGIIIEDYTVKSLVEAIKTVEADDNLLLKLKSGAKESGKKYYFDEYIDNLVDTLK